MQDNEIQGFLELALDYDYMLDSFTLNQHFPYPLRLLKTENGEELWNMLEILNFSIISCPFVLKNTPFRSFHEEIIICIEQDIQYNGTTHWLDYLINKLDNDTSNFGSSTFPTHTNFTFKEFLSSYRLTRSDIPLGNLPDLFTFVYCAKIIQDKYKIRENIKALRKNSNIPFTIDTASKLVLPSEYMLY
ncbi:hypothetical protein FQT01_00765 [Enterococcus faecalis]|uniref:hypothetical protein n=1 Tax=Enterococcus faecalis TaxID=1351 RepID=UPI001A9679B1|nr:hypothetical protein [Enterococcus faecalis]MBO1103847.1 hypothetical protein [Enterococcus faecalis]